MDMAGPPLLLHEGQITDKLWNRFHCLFCHGFEERDAESSGILVGGLLVNPDMIVHIARMAKRLSKHVTIYTNAMPDLAPSVKPIIHSSKITIDTRRIASLSLIDDGPQVRVTFTDGSTATEGFIASHPTLEQGGANLVKQLGLETTPQGDILVKQPVQETSVKGVFAAGDAAAPMKSVVSAMYTGSFAGAGMVVQLQQEMEEKDEL